MRSILLLILIALSIGAFVLYIKPQYKTARQSQAEITSYSSNLDTAEKLKTSREELIAKYNNIPKSDLDNLKTLLPDSVDNIRLIIQIDSLAVRNGLSTVRNVNYQTQTADTAATKTKVASSPYEEFVISFETSGQYQNFLSFLSDLEANLRVIDITKIEFSPTATSDQTPATSMGYKITLKTYWLKQ